MKDQIESTDQVSAQTAAPDSASHAPSGPAAVQSAGAMRRPTRPKATPGGHKARPARPARPAQPSHSARPTPGARPAHAHQTLLEEDDGFFERHRAKLVIGALLLVVGGGAYFMTKGKSGPAPAKQQEHLISVAPMPHLPPPPPPPPPKVQPPPKAEDKMVQETAPESKPKEAEAPKPAPAETLGTNLKGDGPGMAGLGGSGNGGGLFGGKGGGGGSKFGWYAGQVQTRVAEALRQNSHTKSASMKIQVRIWADSTGRISKAKLDGTTGDPKLDTAIQNEVLTGLQLQQPPPADMRMPIVMRLTARRP